MIKGNKGQADSREEGEEGSEKQSEKSGWKEGAVKRRRRSSAPESPKGIRFARC